MTYIVKSKEEESVTKDGPDEDVTKDAGNKALLVGHHDGSVPVNGNKGPGKRARNDWSVDEARVRVVAEVERGEVDEVGNENHLSPSKVRADKEHDKGKVEEVVEDEVATNTGRGVDGVSVFGEEVQDVAKLKGEEEDPRVLLVDGIHLFEFHACSNSPVDGSNDVVHGKGTGIQIVLVPDPLANMVTIVGSVNGVVDRNGDGQQPSEGREDFVSGDGTTAVGFAPREGVY